jgi:hypothetical protein
VDTNPKRDTYPSLFADPIGNCFRTKPNASADAKVRDLPCFCVFVNRDFRYSQNIGKLFRVHRAVMPCYPVTNADDGCYNIG